MRKPKPIPGVEIRERRRRNGAAYYRFRVRYINGAGVRDEEEFDTPKEAKDFKAKLRLMKRSGVLRELDAGKETLAEFMEDYWRLYAKRHLAKVTRKKNRGMWNKHILPRLGHKQLRQITPMALCEYIAELEKDGVSPSQIRCALGMLQSMFARAVEWGRATFNPVKQIKKPAAPRQRAVQPLAPEVIERIRAAMLRADPLRGVRDATMVSLLGYTGMRPEEVLALEVRHIRQMTVLIEQKVSLGEVLAGQKTYRPPRTAELFAAVRGDVRTYQLAFGLREGLLFTIDGAPWSQTAYNNWRKRVWQSACVAAGVGRIEVVKGKDGKMRRTYRGPIPYDLRHSHASLLIHEGKKSVVEIANSLGHSVDTLLRVYSHIIAEIADRPKVSAEQAIAEARQKLAAESELSEAA